MVSVLQALFSTVFFSIFSKSKSDIHSQGFIAVHSAFFQKKIRKFCKVALMASKDLVLVSLKCSCPKIHISLSFSSLCSPLFVINALFFWLLEHCGRGGKIANLRKNFLPKTYLNIFLFNSWRMYGGKN